MVTSEYDGVVRERITQENRPVGLLIDKPNHKVWVKSWAALLRDAESRLKFVQDQLRIEVSTEEIEMRIAELKASVLKTEALNLGEGSGERTEESKGRRKQSGRSANRPPPTPPMLWVPPT